MRHVLQVQVEGGVIANWGDPNSAMPRPKLHGGKRKEAAGRRSPDLQDDASPAGIRRPAAAERRSKTQEDRVAVPVFKGKARAPEVSPPQKRKRAVQVVSRDDEDNDDSSEEGEHEGEQGGEFTLQSSRYTSRP